MSLTYVWRIAIGRSNFQAYALTITMITLQAECTEKDIDADFIEGDITFDDFDAITESKKGSSPVARLYYRLTSFDWILQFNMAFRLPE